MLSKQKAINTYRPQLVLEKTADLDWFMDFTEGRTGLTKGQLLLVVQELREALIFFAREGRSFKLAGIGTFLPSIKLSG